MSTRLRYQVTNSVAEITFVREDGKLNILDTQTIQDLTAALEDARRDPDVRAILITGEGKAFLAGADISAFPTQRGPEARDLAARGHHVATAMELMPKPILAAVNGFALGGGCEMAMACDIIYSSDKAKFGQPEINLGLIPGFGGTQRLTRLVGAQRARELILTGRTIDAEEAKRIGLICDLFPHDALLTEVRTVAATLAKKPSFALAQAKRVIRLGQDVPLEVANELEVQAFGLCFDTDDQKEGARAFIEKRPPVWKI